MPISESQAFQKGIEKSRAEIAEEELKKMKEDRQPPDVPVSFRDIEKSRAEIAEEELQKMKEDRQPPQIIEDDSKEIKRTIDFMVDEINGLKAIAQTAEEWEEIIRKLEELERFWYWAENRKSDGNGVISEKIFENLTEWAREIMGENFYGKEEIEKAFGFKIEESDIPLIPYSQEDLEKAKELGEMLILRIEKDGENNPMTLQRINELVQFGALDSVDWYQNEDFYKNDSLKAEWKLVGSSFVPDSTNKDYVEQTRALRDYLKKSEMLPKEEEAECSDGILAVMQLALWEGKKLGVNIQLADLMVNQRHRRSPVEIVYDWMLCFKNTGDNGVLDYCYDWSNTLSSKGHFVRVGGVVNNGVMVAEWFTNSKRNDFGVICVR